MIHVPGNDNFNAAYFWNPGQFLGLSNASSAPAGPVAYTWDLGVTAAPLANLGSRWPRLQVSEFSVLPNVLPLTDSANSRSLLLSSIQSNVRDHTTCPDTGLFAGIGSEASPPCESRSSICGSCVPRGIDESHTGQRSCGWCPSTKTCMEPDDTSLDYPAKGTCDGSELIVNPDLCPAPDGNHTKTVIIILAGVGSALLAAGAFALKRRRRRSRHTHTESEQESAAVNYSQVPE
jgi:LPXTG-motif cell wall-anchored protein